MFDNRDVTKWFTWKCDHISEGVQLLKEIHLHMRNIDVIDITFQSLTAVGSVRCD